MKKLQLPDIIETAKKRPLSINPLTGSFIYYEKVQTEDQKIIPIEKLNQEQLMKLIVERELSNEPNTTVTLNGESFSNEELAKEILLQTKIGKQIYNSEVDYLKFYLEQFPDDCFEK
jgi:hypothetical protein